MQEKRQGTEMKTGVCNSTEMISGQATVVVNWNMNYVSLPSPLAEPPNKTKRKERNKLEL